MDGADGPVLTAVLQTRQVQYSLRCLSNFTMSVRLLYRRDRVSPRRGQYGVSSVNVVMQHGIVVQSGQICEHR